MTDWTTEIRGPVQSRGEALEGVSAGAHDGDVCPLCGSKEVAANSPATVYACGSRDYDQRPGTFVRGCGLPAKEVG